MRIRYHNDHFEIEKENNVQQKLDFLPSMISLCSSNYLLQTTLTPVKILKCNAAASVPSSFSNVHCVIKYYGKDSRPLYNIFTREIPGLIHWIKVCYFHTAEISKSGNFSFAAVNADLTVANWVLPATRILYVFDQHGDAFSTGMDITSMYKGITCTLSGIWFPRKDNF